MKKLILIMLVVGFSQVSKAEGLLGDSTEREHFAYHFAASGALYTAQYLFMHDVLGCTKTDSFIFSAFSTLLIGFTYKALEQMDQSQNVDFGRPMIYNGIGVVIPAIVLWHFDL
jgi:hypothetical protein